jgi:hypothetical protein
MRTDKVRCESQNNPRKDFILIDTLSIESSRRSYLNLLLFIFMIHWHWSLVQLRAKRDHVLIRVRHE